MSEHEHCWHVFTGPHMTVLEPGHIILQCCMCPTRRAVHRDHARDEIRAHRAFNARVL